MQIVGIPRSHDGKRWIGFLRGRWKIGDPQEGLGDIFETCQRFRLLAFLGSSDLLQSIEVPSKILSDAMSFV